MKKLIIICAVILILSGCGKKTDIKPIVKNISFNTDITYYNEKYAAKGSIDSDGILVLQIVDPSELSGMTFKVDGEDVKINYKGLTISPNSNSLSSAAIGMLCSGFSVAEQNNADYEYGEKNYTVTAKTDNGEFIMSYAPTGLPLEIKCLSAAFEAKFYDIKLLGNE